MSERAHLPAPEGIYDAFISYSRKDYEFVRRVYERLEASGRKVWMDEGNIAHGESLPRVITAAIEASAAFVFFISPDSVNPKSSPWPLLELEHSQRFKKKLVTTLCREGVETSSLPEPLRNTLWIDARGMDLDQLTFHLNKALEHDQEWRFAHTRLQMRTSEWKALEYDNSLLLQGKDLERTHQAIRASAGRKPSLLPEQEQYLRASEAQQAKDSALRLAQEAEDLSAKRPDLMQLSVLLAVESSRLHANARAYQVLRHHLARMPRPVARLLEAGWPLALDPSGRLLATVKAVMKPGGLHDSQVQVWDVPQGRLLVQLPPGKQVRAAAFSPDGARLVTMSVDPAVQLWELSSGQQLGQVKAGMGTAHGYALHPEGTWLAMSGATVVPHSSGGFVDDFRSEGWAVVDGRQLVPWNRAEGLQDLTFSPNGGLLVGTKQEHLILRDVRTEGEVRIPLAEQAGPWAFSADGSFLSMPGPEDTVMVYETANGQVVTRVHHTAGIEALALHPDGSLLAVAGEDDSIRVWAVAQGRDVLRLSLKEPVRSMTFSPDGRYLMTVCADHTARVWPVSSGQEEVRVADIESARFIADGRLMTHSRDGSVWLWEMTTVTEAVASIRHQEEGHERATLNAAAFHPNGGLLATAGSDGTARLWNVRSLEEVRRLPHAAGVKAVSFDREGKWLGTLTLSGTVSVWDVAEARERTRSAPGSAKVQALAFSPDGTCLATGGDDNAVWLWDMASGQPVRSMLHTGRVRALCFNMDGKSLATASGPSSQRPFFLMARAGDSASVWKVHSGEEVARVQHEPPPESSLGLHPDVDAVALSPDGGLLATASKDTTARLWTVPGGQQKARLEHVGSVSALVFSPDGRYLATADEQAARLWDVTNGRLVARMHHGVRVRALAFDPVGKYLATTCDDGQFRVWEVPAGLEVARRGGDSIVGNSVAFSPDAKCLAAVCSDGAVRLWLWEPGWLLAEACARLARNLSREEWRQHFGDSEYRRTCPTLPGPSR